MDPRPGFLGQVPTLGLGGVFAVPSFKTYNVHRSPTLRVHVPK